jgi:hypothetical protein
MLKWFSLNKIIMLPSIILFKKKMLLCIPFDILTFIYDPKILYKKFL